MSNQQSVKSAAKQNTSFLRSPFARMFLGPHFCQQIRTLVVLLLTDWRSLAVIGKLASCASSSSCYFRHEKSSSMFTSGSVENIAVAFDVRGLGCETQVMHLIKFELWFQDFGDFRPDSPPVVPHFLLRCNTRLQSLCSLKLFNILCSRKQTAE